jgi:hypothetical protein
MKKSQFDSISTLTSKKDDFYYSKDGLIIFTEKYHLKIEDIVAKASASTVPMVLISNIPTYNDQV